MEASCTFSNAQSSLPGGSCLLSLVKEVEQVLGNMKPGPQSCPPPGLVPIRVLILSSSCSNVFPLLRLHCLLSLAIDKSAVRPRVVPL